MGPRRLSFAVVQLSVVVLLFLCAPCRAQGIRFASPPEAPSLRGGVGNGGGGNAADLPLRPPPDKPLRVVARLAPIPESSPKPNVSLTYIVGFGSPTTIPMELVPVEGNATATSSSSFAAEIPAAALPAGALVRWAATAALPSSSSPSQKTAAVRCPRRTDDWLGTVVEPQKEPPSKLPTLEWFRSGGDGQHWLWFEGSLRPLAAVSRKGTTSLGWPKPKLKLEFKKDYDVEEGGGGGGGGGDGGGKLVLRRPFGISAAADADGGDGGEAAATTATAKKTPSAVDLDSLWWEPGANSYVRQAAAFAALRRVAGAPALLMRHVVVRRDGSFYGLHALVERAGTSWLRREGLINSSDNNDDNAADADAADVSLYKPISASAALAPNVPLQLMHLVWKTEHGETRHADIDDFTRKLANGKLRGGRSSASGRGRGRGRRNGGGGGDDGGEEEASAAQWLLDALDVPTTLNYLCTAAVILQQDRCTKNYYLLQERGRDREGGLTSRWSLIAGDSKTAFGSDSGFGGEHARDYALNHADQFTSPLFCDRGHPQDVEGTSVEPWSGVVVAPIDGAVVGKQSDGGRRRRRSKQRRRRSVLEAAAETKKSPSPPSSPSTSVAPRIEPPPAGRPADPRPLLGCAADTTPLTAFDGSPPSTFNAVVDALLRCPATRAMFLRRARTLTEQLHGRFAGGNDTTTTNGALFPIVTELASSVAADAARDDAVWRGGDPSLGARQLLEEQIPGRGRQLIEAYGERGYIARGLLPEAQPSVLPASAVRVVVLRGGGGGSGSEKSRSPSSSPEADQIIAAISSTTSSSLDLSNYLLRIGKAEVAFPPGTVTPPGGWAVVAGGKGRRRRQKATNGDDKTFLRLSPAVGARLAREAGLQGLTLSVQGEQREIKETTAPEGVVSLVAPGGEAVVLS